MKSRLPFLVTSALTLALAAPAPASPGQGRAHAQAKDKDKDKKKDKDKDKSKDGREDHSRDGDRRGDRDWDDRDGSGKMTICHVPPGNPAARKTIEVGESAWGAHRDHGDHRGACDDGRPGDGRGTFERLDRNDDGRISRAEWPHSREAFERLDRNDDGLLTRGEYRRF